MFQLLWLMPSETSASAKRAQAPHLHGSEPNGNQTAFGPIGLLLCVVSCCCLTEDVRTHC